jgi:hypothetical protein
MATVQFRYTRRVFFPPHKAGEKGETKELPVQVAEQLEQQGYGHIIGKEDDDESAGRQNTGSGKRSKKKTV